MSILVSVKRQKGTTEDEMVGWHHPLDGHEFEQALGAGDGQGGLACCGPWGHGIRHAIPRVNHKQHMSTKKGINQES